MLEDVEGKGSWVVPATKLQPSLVTTLGLETHLLHLFQFPLLLELQLVFSLAHDFQFSLAVEFCLPFSGFFFLSKPLGLDFPLSGQFQFADSGSFDFLSQPLFFQSLDFSITFSLGLAHDVLHVSAVVSIRCIHITDLCSSNDGWNSDGMDHHFLSGQSLYGEVVNN